MPRPSPKPQARAAASGGGEEERRRGRERRSRTESANSGRHRKRRFDDFKFWTSQVGQAKGRRRKTTDDDDDDDDDGSNYTLKVFTIFMTLHWSISQMAEEVTVKLIVQQDCRDLML